MNREDKFENNTMERKKEPLALWPTREEYFKRMNAYLAENRKAVEDKLRSEGYADEEIADVSTLMIRGQFAFRFVSEVTHLQNKVKTMVTWSMGVNRRDRAVTVPRIFLNDLEVEDYDNLLEAVRNDKEPSIRKIDMYVNQGEIRNAAKQARRYYDLYLESTPGDTEGAEDIKREMLAEAAMKTEIGVVEEVAHSLFLASVFGSKYKLLLWPEEHKGYTSHLPGDEQILKIDTDEEALIRKEKYEDKLIEIKARVLVKLFKEKYYPQ